MTRSSIMRQADLVIGVTCYGLGCYVSTKHLEVVPEKFGITIVL